MRVVVTGGLGYIGSHCCVARELGWTAKLGIKDMCLDARRWQSDNPQGYPD